MATIRTCSAASSGMTSGSGFAIANTIASSFMRSRSAASTTPGPGQADEQVRALEHVGGPARRRSLLVLSAYQRFSGCISSQSSRPT